MRISVPRQMKIPISNDLGLQEFALAMFPYRFHVNIVVLSKSNHGNIPVIAPHIQFYKRKNPLLTIGRSFINSKKITLYVANDSNHYEREMNNEVHSFKAVKPK